MTLSFLTKINGKPNHFVEKIWQGLLTNNLEFSLFDLPNFLSNVPGLKDYVIGDLPAKLHTIRTDEKDRWKEGRDIHMVINNRTPNRLQFAPVVKCLSVQKIQIKHFEASVEVEIDDEPFGLVYHHGLDEGVYEWTNTLEKLAVNDGFDSVEAFFKYFDKDFTGKIIHWTNLRY